MKEPMRADGGWENSWWASALAGVLIVAFMVAAFYAAGGLAGTVAP